MSIREAIAVCINHANQLSLSCHGEHSHQIICEDHISNDDFIRVCTHGSETTVSFSPDHINQADTARQISRDLCVWIERHEEDERPLDQIVLDFREIDRIGSAGLNGLIGIKTKARSRGIRLILANVQESVRDVFALTRLERMFEFRSGDDELSFELEFRL